MTEQNAIAIRPSEPELTPYEVIERVISSGDIARMDPAGRVAFYWRVCESLGLNPMTQPFAYLNLDGKIVLYARKDATEQLRRVNRVSVTSLSRDRDDEAGIYTVTAHGRLPDGREDEASGVVAIKGLSGMALANALMKAETKAKRRLTLSLVGLGFLDESEVEGLGETVAVNPATGQFVQPDKPSLLEAVQRQAEMLASPASESAIHPTPDAPSVSVRPGEPPAILAEEPEPEPFFAEPMTVEASAHVTVVPEPEEEDEEASELMEAILAVAGELTINELADLARVAGMGKRAFASAIDCVPSDVGIRIEKMTGAQRHQLAASMGMLGGGTR